MGCTANSPLPFVLGLLVLAPGCGGHGPGAGGPRTTAAPVTQAEPRLASLRIHPDGELELENARGAGFQLAVDGHYTAPQGDFPRDLTREVSYEVEDPSVCQVGGEGLIRPLREGRTRIVLRYAGFEAATDVVVVAPRAGDPPRFTALSVLPPERTLSPVDPVQGLSSYQQLVVVGTDVEGRRHDLTRSLAISLEDEQGQPSPLALVSPTGLVWALQPGVLRAAARIRADNLAAGTRLVLGDGVAHPLPMESLYLGAPLAGSSNPIDQAVLAALRSRLIEPAPLCEDGEFLRRLYGDALDRAPTPAEQEAFAADPDPDKRAAEVDRVLASSAFVERWARVLGEWLQEPRRAWLLGDAHQRFDLRPPNDTLLVKVDGGATQTVTFVAADFPNQGPQGALAGEVADKINQVLQGARAAQEVEQVSLTTSGSGVGRSLEVLASGGATALGLAGKRDLVIDTWARDGLQAGKTLGQLTAELVAGQVEAFELHKPTAADKVDALLLAATGMTAKCAKCHDHPLTGPSDTVRWTQAERYPLDAFFAVTPAEATPYDGRTGQRVGRPRQPAFVLEPSVPVGVTLATPLPRRRAALAGLLPASQAFRRGLAHRILAEVSAPLLDPNQFLERNVEAVAVPAVLEAITQAFTAARSDLAGFLRVVFGSRTYQLSSADEGRDPTLDPLLYRRTLRPRHAEVIGAALDALTGAPTNAAGQAYLLDTFGYPARRATIDERKLAVNLAQALLLENSPVVHDRLRGPASLPAQLAAAVNGGQLTRDEAVSRLFRATLARDPEAAERAACDETLDQATGLQAGLEDVAAALLGTAEFALD